MFKKFLLLSCFSLPFFTVSDVSALANLFKQKPVMVLHWQENGVENEFEVRPQEAKFIQDYVVPLVKKLSNCQHSGSRLAKYASMFTATGAAGLSWYFGVSDKIQNVLAESDLGNITWLRWGAPALIGGLTFFVARPLLKRLFTFLSLAQEKKQWKNQIKNEIEKMQGSSWNLLKRLVQAITNLRTLVTVRFFRLKHALQQTLGQNDCSDEMKQKLFGFKNPTDCNNEFILVMKRLLDIDTKNLFWNPNSELQSFVLALCSDA